METDRERRVPEAGEIRATENGRRGRVQVDVEKLGQYVRTAGHVHEQTALLTDGAQSTSTTGHDPVGDRRHPRGGLEAKDVEEKAGNRQAREQPSADSSFQRERTGVGGWVVHRAWRRAHIQIHSETRSDVKLSLIHI